VDSYLLGGRSLFFSLLVLLRATGSKLLADSSDGGGAEKEDEDETAFRASVVALRQEGGRMAHAEDLQKAAEVRNGSSRRTMVDGKIITRYNVCPSLVFRL